MKKQILSSFAVLAATAVAISQFVATTHADRGESGQAPDAVGDVSRDLEVRMVQEHAELAGPDVIVGVLPNAQYFGTSGGVRAYSIATTSCNNGDVNLDWFAGSINHPVIGQNVYRYRTVDGHGRFEQVGASWLKHGFCALQGTACGSCDPVGSCCCSQLGPGCSDPYGSGLNGNWSDLGPRGEVNPTSGVIEVWPHSLSSGSSTTRGRIQIKDTDLVTGANYYVEGHYVALDDADAGNAANNASYRAATLSGTSLITTGSTVQQKPAVRAWEIVQPSVSFTKISFDSGDGNEIFNVLWDVTDNGDGTWHYEYVIHNLNSNRGAGSFSVPIGENVNITNVDFHGIDHHSGDGDWTASGDYDNQDWTWDVTDSAVTWSVQEVSPANNSNALWWGFSYNFRFDADTAPEGVSGTVVPFKSGSPTDVPLNIDGPSDGPIDDPCPGDTNGDNLLNIDDIVNAVVCFGQNGVPDCAGPGTTGDIDDGSGTGMPDGLNNIDDIVYAVLRFGASCP